MPAFTSNLVPDPDGKVNLVFRCTGGCNEDVLIRVFPKDLNDYMGGKGYIQTLFPYLTPAEREMFNTAICGTCWARLFPPPDEGDEGIDTDMEVRWTGLPDWAKVMAGSKGLNRDDVRWERGGTERYFAYDQSGTNLLDVLDRR